MILLHFVPIVVFLLLNAATVRIGKKSFGISMPVTLMIAVFLMLISQIICRSFSPAYILILILGIGAAVLLVLNIKDAEFRDNYFSAGFICVLGIGLIVGAMDLGRHYSMWDEFSHWGKMVKEMLRLDTLYSVPEANLLVHKDYPPFASLFETLWCRLSGGYSEASVNRAIHFFQLALIAPLIAEKLGIKKRFLGKTLIALSVVAFGVLTMLSFGSEKYYPTVYPDFLVSALFAYAMVLIYDSELRETVFATVALILTQVTMVMTKQVSIAFVLLVWFFYTITVLFKKSRRSIDAVYSLLILGIPVLASKMWSIYTESLGLEGQFSLSRISFAALWDIVCGGGSPEQAETFILLKQAMISTPISLGIFKLSYLGFVLFALIVFIAFRFMFAERFGKKELINSVVVLICGSAAYAFLIFLTYLFTFAPEEMLSLRSYRRYINGYVLGEILFICYIYWDNLMFTFSKEGVKNRVIRIIPFALLFILLTDFGNIRVLMPERIKGTPSDYLDYEAMGDYLNQNTQAGDRILLVSSENMKKGFYLNYFLNDGRVLDSAYLYSDVAAVSADDSEYWNSLAVNAMNDDYIMIIDATPAVIEVLGRNLETEKIKDNTLYLINKDSESLVLTGIN